MRGRRGVDSQFRLQLNFGVKLLRPGFGRSAQPVALRGTVSPTGPYIFGAGNPGC